MMLGPTATIRNHSVGGDWEASPSGLFVPPRCQ